MAKQQPESETVHRIVAKLDGPKDDIVILFIPSHDKSKPQKKLKDQDRWASAALELLCKLYGGATTLHAYQGGWLDEDGNLLLDQPMMVQSLADRSSIENDAKLFELVAFCKRMGRQTNQASVMLIFNDVRHYLEDFKE